ncbi:hypothetical protein GCM10023310_33260 [Paenibacillus vulneris]
MIEGYSLRKCAEQLHDEVTHVTLFYWRHKILSALKQIPTEAFQGIVEMDETYFLFSEKGKRNITERKPRKRGGKAKYRGISNDQVCVLVARDRQKTITQAFLGVDVFEQRNWMKLLVAIYQIQTCFAPIRGEHSVHTRMRKA